MILQDGIPLGVTSGKSHGFEECKDESTFYSVYPGWDDLRARSLITVETNGPLYCRWTWTSLGSRSYSYIIESLSDSDNGLRLEIEEGLINTSSDVSNALSNLSTDALLMLIKYADHPGSTSYNGLWCDTTKDDFHKTYPGMAELETRGLIAFEVREASPCTNELFWLVTPLAIKSFTYIVDNLVDTLAKK